MSTTDKPDHLKFVLRTFSDAELEGLLSQDSNFRELKPRRRDALLHAMRMDWWNPGVGDAIVFSKEGKLLNGQHRLSAAQIYQRETGKLIWFWVCLNATETAARDMDCVTPRKLIDYFRHAKAGYPELLSVIVSGHARLMSLPKAETNSLISITNSGSGHSGAAISISHAMDIYRRQRGKFEEWTTIGAQLKSAKLPRPGLLAAIGFQLARVNEINAKLFFSYLATGSGLKDKDPILVLRERLLKDRTSSSMMPSMFVGAILIKAWAAWCRGQSMNVLRWASVGPAAESFPDHRVPPDEMQV